MTIVTRFAPSPTGRLHLGHAYSALLAHEAARKDGGRFLLRIEDIDPVRCKPEFTDGIYEDLRWLGLDWENLVRTQSEHMDDYAAALARLDALGVLYPCACTRREIAEEAAASAHAPHLAATGPDGPVYPGTCRNKPRDAGLAARQAHASTTYANTGCAWRLDVQKARMLTGPLVWRDQTRGDIAARFEDFGDIVLARKDVPASYHLCVTVDDHRQGVTYVTRGEDLFRATDIHRLLQALLGYETPRYFHHPLLKDAHGRRFAKRDRAVTLQTLREAGQSPEAVRTLAMQEFSTKDEDRGHSGMTSGSSP